MNNLKGVKIEYHILQSFPTTCLNRDDVGSPKSAIIGGVKRSRVSSQCWKRQVRLCMHDLGINIAKRSKNVEKIILSEISNANDEIEKAVSVISKALTDDTLYYISKEEAKCYAENIKENYQEINKMKDKQPSTYVKKIGKEFLNKGFNQLDGIDIALFGRMVAKAPNLNVEAAASFSHAITTHKSGSEIDYFTAVDDLDVLNDDKKGGHIGTSELSSGTYYRYISLDLGMLKDALGEDENVFKAVEAFTKALYLAVPSARQKTMAGYCLWDYAQVYVRRGQGMQLSFDKPVQADKSGGYLENSINVMKEQLEKREKIMGSLFGCISKHEIGENANYSIDSLVSDLNKDISSL